MAEEAPFYVKQNNMLLVSTKNPTPQQLAIITVANHTILAVLALIIAKLCIPSLISWSGILATFILNFAFGYFANFQALRKFIYNKVKLIYKSIHSLKAPKSSKALKIDMTNHIIDHVEQEVTEWAKDWTQEIRYLKKMERYRREFIDNVSHELKTPIFNMQGYLYTLEEGGIDDPKIRDKYLGRAINNVERIADIVQDLNQISKFESRAVELEKQRFNVCDLVQDVMDDMEMTAQKKSIVLKLKEKTIKAHFVVADRSMIRQVLINLISNSIKYGKEGGHTLIGFYDLDQNILVEVSDNGKGITQEHLPRLFERFYRVDKGRSRSEGGTGLGLSIVKHIIEAHKQTINVRSRSGVGSTFGFTLEKSRTS